MLRISLSTLRVFDDINCLSLASACAVVVLIWYLAWKKPSAATRVSLRLQLTIALIDVTRHILLLGIGVENDMLCIGVAFYAVFVDNLYMFLNVTIAGNLLCLVFFGWTPRKKHTLLYLLGSVGGSLLIVLVPLVMGALGRNQHNICYLAKQVTPSEKQLYFVFLVYFPVIPSVIFCFLAPLLTNAYCHFKTIPQSVYFPNLGSTVKSLVLRVSIYPFTSIFCIGGYALIVVQLGLYNEASIGATYWSLIGLRSTGLINFFAFLLDPAFSELIAVVFNLPAPNPLLKPSKKSLYIQIPEDDCHYQAPPSSPNPEHVVKPFHQTIPPDYAHMNAEFSKLMAYLDLY